MSNFYDFINPLILFPLLLISCSVYYLAPSRLRWITLLVFNTAFYIWISSWAVLILFFVIISNYFVGIWINGRQGNQRVFPLILGIMINLSTWIAFKYGSGAISPLFVARNSAANIIYPLGLSFFTVQNISYLIDVFKKLVPAEQNLGVFAAYVSFFPKIASGPIERAKNLIPQFRQAHPFEWENIRWGIRQIVFGLFKKLVIADRLAILANEVFDNPGDYHGLALAIGIVSFAFQLYFDFAGYSDLALGIARLFGFHLSINFRRPYLAEDAIEFWSRWHISFSTWLRDYIFYPTRRFLLKHFRKQVLIGLIIPPLLTMLASGFWHGTGWTFILWGLYHAVLYISVVLRKQYLGIEPFLMKRLMKYPQIVINFGFITLGWVFFRANSLRDVGIIFLNLFHRNFTLGPLVDKVKLLTFDSAAILIIGAVFVELLLELKYREFDKIPPFVRWVCYLALLIAISAFGIYQSSGNPFVYFRF